MCSLVSIFSPGRYSDGDTTEFDDQPRKLSERLGGAIGNVANRIRRSVGNRKSTDSDEAELPSTGFSYIGTLVSVDELFPHATLHMDCHKSVLGFEPK